MLWTSLLRGPYYTFFTFLWVFPNINGEKMSGFRLAANPLPWSIRAITRYGVGTIHRRWGRIYTTEVVKSLRSEVLGRRRN
jgi:hypothetical protein